MTNKILGYALIVLGSAIMFFSLFNVYLIFSNRTEPVEIFSLPSISLDLSNFLDAEGQTKLNESTAKDGFKTDIVTSEVLNQPLNFFAHMVILSFVLNVGYKLGSLGVQFVRPIKVNLKEENESENNP